MKKSDERRLMRLLHGELPAAEARELERRLERDGRLRSYYEGLAATWQGLELPGSRELPRGFAAGVMAAARREAGELRWSAAPAWARAGAAAAMAAGLMLGAALGGGFAAPAVTDDATLVADAEADAAPLSLAETYWLALEESGGELSDADSGAAERVQ